MIRRVAVLAGTASRTPSLTAETMNQVVPLVQGMEFCQTAGFSTPPGGDDGPGGGANPLEAYFDAHKEGPGIWKWRHYFDIYHRHFSKFVGREVHVLEVGIYSGGSLPMWKHYFGKECRIYGVDIEEACRAYQGEGIEVFIGDQADRAFWARVRKAVPKVDILIDDGGHHSEQQRITLEEMLPHVQPGGVYLCEDIHGTPNPFSSFLQGLAANLNAMAEAEMPPGMAGRASAASRVQQAIGSMHLYPFVAVIERRERSMERFIAPKHGTKWEPFL